MPAGREPTPKLREVVAQVLGAPVTRWEPARGGCTRAGRWVVTLSDGHTAFVKAADDPLTAGWLRTEQQVYASLKGSFMPRCLGQIQDPEEPVLFLEDLSGAHWPPPWQTGQVDAVLRALEELWRLDLPFEVPRLEDQRAEMLGWPKVREAPEQFLALGLCDAQWLEAALPALEAAESRVRLDGDDLLHLDVRGDNLCFSQGRVLLLDWNWVCRGNGKVDVGAWLPSLHREGGPPPEAVLPGEPEIAAMLAGYWAWRAGQPAPTPGSRLREMQKYQLVAALGWAARELGLPPPAGD